ncbi:stigma-specific STIG1-like protein 3 [Trifolium pratense]|uniref:stigma-specific STIG1-like protein 3 n=1 Tax=Trifolium pratense TaxID=57577 RepID=UPI001E68FE99|nr:stigma-specific STIG1-like protein 3 [Trifolium pratense]
MGFLKAIIIIAITMALSITITLNTITQNEPETASIHHDDSRAHEQELIHHEKNKFLPSKRVSRLLAQNPNAPIHCHKDDEICDLSGAKNATCCNNKCMDLGYDKHNCGACKKHCKYTQTCCRGQCVDTYYDKRHCGECNNRCEIGEYCVYGMCSGYA